MKSNTTRKDALIVLLGVPVVATVWLFWGLSALVWPQSVDMPPRRPRT